MRTGDNATANVLFDLEPRRDVITLRAPRAQSVREAAAPRNRDDTEFISLGFRCALPRRMRHRRASFVPNRGGLIFALPPPCLLRPLGHQRFAFTPNPDWFGGFGPSFRCQRRWEVD